MYDKKLIVYFSDSGNTKKLAEYSLISPKTRHPFLQCGPIR